MVTSGAGADLAAMAAAAVTAVLAAAGAVNAAAIVDELAQAVVAPTFQVLHYMLA
jgi:hypothetical protein